MNSAMLSKMLLAFSSICMLYFGSAQQSYGNSTVSALFAFGDSILDTGNNNLLLTLAKVNFYPYGRDFIGGRATGRFGNGRVFSDMIGIYIDLCTCSYMFSIFFKGKFYILQILSDTDRQSICLCSRRFGIEEYLTSIS